jgi:hypothetical protein
MLHVRGNASRDITFRVEILPRSGETLNARITYGGLGGKGLNQAIAGGAAPDFPFATLYRLRRWENGQFHNVLEGGQVLSSRLT